MFEKVKESFYKWSNETTELWEDRRYIRSILTCLLPPVLIGLILVLIIKAVIAGFNFLCRYYAQLIFAAFAICVFVAWLDKRRADKIDLERQEQDIRERRDYSDKLETALTEDATYVAQAYVIFDVAKELGPLGIVPPMRPSDLYSPNRMIYVSNRTVGLSLFLLQKDREKVDINLLKHTLQTKVDQRLQAGEFPDIPAQHVYQGRVYSGFVIDMIRDNDGYLNVYTALVNDAYCRYRENRELNKYRLLPSVDRRDVDY